MVILQVHFEKIWQFEFGKITDSIRIKDYIRSLKRAVFFLYILTILRSLYSVYISLSNTTNINACFTFRKKNYTITIKFMNFGKTEITYKNNIGKTDKTC